MDVSMQSIERSIDELANEICPLAGHINAANHRFLALIAEFDRRNGWSDSATHSCAHWLNWKCGIALRARDKACRFPGCCNARYIDMHHIKHWANGGETKPSNLVSLCRFHHRAVHEGGFNVEILDDGAFRFIDPNGDAS